MSNKKVDNVAHESNKHSSSPEVQSTRDKSKNSNDQNIPEDHMPGFRSFTISRPLSGHEMNKIMNDLCGYNKKFPCSLSKDNIIEQMKTYYDIDAEKHLKVFIGGYEFFSGFLRWNIKRYRTIIENENSESVDYFLEVEISPEEFSEREYLTYDANSLKIIEADYIKEAWIISPLLEDISSFKLRHIKYFTSLYFEEMCSHELIEDLVKQSNIHSKYCEWEMYPLKDSKPSPFMDRRSVEISWDFAHDKPHAIDIYIKRTFPRAYTWNELIGYDSIHTKLIIEHMLSDEYRRRSIAAYLKVAFVGGSYYSMEKAVRIIESSNLVENKKHGLISALKFVRENEGILNAKMVLKYKDELFNFVNSLHELVELGINPVTIPEKYKIEKLSNPIYRYLEHPDNRVGDKKKASSRVEIEEKIGIIGTACRTS